MAARRNVRISTKARRTALKGLNLPKPAGGKRPFPAWHYAMLNDKARNTAIARAISGLDLKGKTVVEIGAGSGIISILFARAGAERIIACEMNHAMAQVAIETIHRAGLNERIALLPMSSTMAIDQGLMPENPDVIFTETVDCGVIGEGFHPIARDIRRIMGPDTLILPNEIRQFGAIVSSEVIYGQNHVGDIFGVDMSPLNAYATQGYFPARADCFGADMLTRPALLRTYDYGRDLEAAEVAMPVTHGGRAHGLLSWFELQLGDQMVSNAPGGQSHWHQAFHPFASPVDMEKGETASILLDDDGVAHLLR